jgi:hypothetical protein
MTRKKKVIEKPALQFPQNIKVHAYDPSGLGTCLICGRKASDKIHLRPHSFEVNLSSTLRKCMCGLSRFHSIHK